MLLHVDGDRSSEGEWDVEPHPANAIQLNGLVFRRLANSHSHAFNLVLRGHVQEDVDFCSGRKEACYSADVLDGQLNFELSTDVCRDGAGWDDYCRRARYLHHAQGDTRDADPNEMGRALVQAAQRAGPHVSLSGRCYLYSGLQHRVYVDVA